MYYIINSIVGCTLKRDTEVIGYIAIPIVELYLIKRSDILGVLIIHSSMQLSV